MNPWCRPRPKSFDSQLSAAPSGPGEVYDTQNTQLLESTRVQLWKCLGALRHWGNPFTHLLLPPQWGGPGIDHCRGRSQNPEPLSGLLPPPCPGPTDSESLSTSCMTPTGLGADDLMTWRNFPSEKHRFQVTKDLSLLLLLLLWTYL